MIDQNFENALGVLKDMKIGLFLSDNQFIEGIFRDIKQDHIIVDVNDKLFYFSLQHVRALSKNAQDFCVSPKITPHLDRNYLTDILKELKYSLVTINCLGSQAFFGVLSSISEDHIILINDKEQLYIQKSFISSIYKGMYETNEEDTESNQEKAVLESSSPNHNERQEQPDSRLDDDIQDNQDVVSTAKQRTDENDSDRRDEKPYRKKRTKERTEVEKLDDERFQIRPDRSSHLSDLRSSQSAKNEMQFVLAGSKFKNHKKSKEQINLKEILNDLHANEYENNSIDKISKSANYERNSNKKNRRFKSFQSLSTESSKHHLEKKVENREDIKERKKDVQFVEENVFSPPVRRLSAKEEKEMLEQQYYALMKHAEKMYRSLRD